MSSLPFQLPFFWKKRGYIMNEKRHYDFMSAVALTILSIAIIIGSFQIQGQTDAEIYVSPALMPMILGITLLFCSFLQLAESLKEGGMKARMKEIKIWSKETAGAKSTVNILIGVAIMAVYTFLLLPNLPFAVSSLIFMVVLLGFLKATSPVRIGLLAAGAVAFIVLLFQVLFRVPLP